MENNPQFDAAALQVAIDAAKKNKSTKVNDE